MWIVRPRHPKPSARVIDGPGGGYVHPLTSDYWRLVRALTTAPAELVVPRLPLAPDATIDDVLPRFLAVHRTGVRRDPDLPTILTCSLQAEHACLRGCR